MADFRPFGARRRRLGEILIDENLLTQEQLDQALVEAKEEGKRLGDYLISTGMISDDKIAKAVASQLKIPFMEDLESRVISEDLINLVSADILRKNKMIPVYFDEYNPNVVIVAMADPLDQRAADDFSLMSNMNVEVAAATSHSISAMLDKYLGSSEAAEIAKRYRMERGEDPSAANADAAKEDDATENSAIVQLVRELIGLAARQRTSDIHIEATETQVRVRYRIDGVLYEKNSYDISMLPAIMARIKIISGMDISEKRKPQDGRMTQNFDGREFDIRVSILPTVYGEKCVMRLAEKKALTRDKKDLGFTDEEMAAFENLLRNPNGIFLVTGPTGSGKSTTLYTVLHELCTSEVNIITVEDPVEANVPGVNQVQVNVKAELTFASALRSILRQDPDIIMIGEIRDGETANIAVQASITGHLVVSTLHTNSAPASMIRLINMGVEGYLLADSVIGVIAQRLVRKLCPSCKEEYTPSPEECRRMDLDPANPPRIYRVPENCQCTACGGKGYTGRTGVYEIMTVTPGLQRLISANASVEEIKNQAMKDGMHTLAQSARDRVLRGVTTYKEMMRIAYANEGEE